MRVTILLTLAILAVPHDTDEAKKALAAIHQVDGKVVFDEKTPGRPVISINL